MEKYLLDTCTFLWIILGSDKIPTKVRKIFEDPENAIYFSAASAAEIAIKCSLKKLVLPSPVAEFIIEQRENHGISFLPLEERPALQLYRLPHVHQDPFDRMLVCQALIEGLTILTPDEGIASYGIPTVWN